jgi:multicomponent Na+:H+ antiporter subunit D
MAVIWAEVFWKKAPESPEIEVEPLPSRYWWLSALPVGVLAALMVAIGFFPEPFFEFSRRAAEQLVNPNEYIQTVFGKSL